MKQIRIAFRNASVEVRSDAGDLLATIGRRFRHLRGDGALTPVASLEIERSGDRFRCIGPGGSLDELASLEAAARWAQYHAIEQLIVARQELIWFHGAAVGIGGRALVIPGRRGQGKSTLSRALWERGATFLTDDVMPVEVDTDRVVPFPQLPAIRRDPGLDLDDEALARVKKEEIEISERVETHPLPVAAVVLPGFERNAMPEIRTSTPGRAALALLEGCWNLERHGAAAAQYVARLSPSIPACQLIFSDYRPAVEMLSEWAARVIGETV